MEVLIINFIEQKAESGMAVWRKGEVGMGYINIKVVVWMGAWWGLVDNNM